MDKTAGRSVFYRVFHEVVQDLVDVPLCGQYGGSVICLTMQVYTSLPGHRLQHTGHALQHRLHFHSNGRLYGATVQPGQAEKILGDPFQTAGFVPNIRHEFPGSLRVYIFCLQNGIRQQFNACQRRFHLMGCIRHKSAPGFLCCLQAVGETVELFGDLRDLVRAFYLSAVIIRTFPHIADGLQKMTDAAGKHPGEQQADSQNEHRHHSGNGY